VRRREVVGDCRISFKASEPPNTSMAHWRKCARACCSRRASSNSCFQHVVAVEMDCIIDDSGNRDLIDSCQLEAIVIQVQRSRPSGRIHGSAVVVGDWCSRPQFPSSRSNGQHPIETSQLNPRLVGECLADSPADHRIFARLQHPDSDNESVGVRRNALVRWFSGVRI